MACSCSAKRTRNVTLPPASPRSRVLVDSCYTGFLLAPASPDNVLHVTFTLVTRIFPLLIPFFFAAVDRPGHLPRSRKHLRVLERDLVVDPVRADHRPAFDHM